MGGSRTKIGILRGLIALGLLSSLVVTTGPGHAVSAGASPSGIWIYVAPGGNDGNPGTRARPLRTLAAAQRVVRARNRNMTGNITVYLESGTYRLSAPLQLGPLDSGTNGHTVEWTSSPKVTAVISGSDRVSNWHLTNASKNIWAARVPVDANTRQIYVNGERASPAAGQSPVKLQRTWKGYVAASSVMAHWKDPKGIDFVYPSQLGYFSEPICPVASIKGKIITMAQPCWDNSNYRVQNLVGWEGDPLTTPTYIENAYELLDQPGEFYLDRSTRMLYYIPRPGQDMRSADVEVPFLQPLVTGGGSPTQQLHNVTFSNLQFSYATWMQPSSTEGFSDQQAGYTITGKRGYATEGLCRLVPHGTCPYGAWTKEPGNIQLSYDFDISFINDRFIHLGAAGLDLDNGSRYDIVKGCVFTDISGNGLEVGNVNMPEANAPSQTTNVKVIDNHLYGLPAEYHGGVGILAGYVADTTISHNQIDHTPWVAVSIGWGGWLDKRELPPVPNFSHDNVISSNRIFDFMQVLKDGGGIYTQGIQGTSMATGLKVAGNVVHDQLDWGSALKSDDGATYVTYFQNVLYNDTYDWDNPEYDYRSRPGKPSHSYNPQLIEANWWQQGFPDYFDKGIRFLHNKIITGPTVVPASVMQNAGLQAGFRSLLAWKPAGRSVPSAPLTVSALYAYAGRAYITWHPSYAEGSSPVESYTLRVCGPRGQAGPRDCPQAPVSPVTLSTNDFSRLGYAVVSGLTDGHTYGVTVTARNAEGDSVTSLPAWVTPGPSQPALPAQPTHLHVETGRGVVTLVWYRPNNAVSVHVLAVSHKKSRDAAAPAARARPIFVLSYTVTGSTGQQFRVTGHEELISTNTGARVMKVIGGLVRGRRYRFSIRAVTPAGAGPAARSGWIATQ